MTNIEKILDGIEVEYLPLGEITTYEQPTAYLVKSTNYKDDFQTPVLTAGKTFILGYTDETTGIYKASINPVIIFDDFTTANKWVEFDFKAKSSAMKMITSKDESKVLLRYIYHWLNTLPSELIEGDHKRQWISNFSNKMIPIPCPENQEKSLAIQLAIVETLDKFTKLEAELEAELETELDCRNRQYEYYCNKLLYTDLSIVNPKANNITYKTVGDIFDIRNGYTPSKANMDYWMGGSIPWFRMEDIRTNGSILNDSIQHITPHAIKGKGLFKANSIILATTATIGVHALLKVDSLANQQFTNFSIRKALEDSILPEFLYYYFFVIDEWCKQNVHISSFPSVDMEKLNKQLVPIPPLSEQRRIVSILCKFDKLTTSISEDLPREIELRRKQYEYYRNKLLSFSNAKITQ